MGEGPQQHDDVAALDPAAARSARAAGRPGSAPRRRSPSGCGRRPAARARFPPRPSPLRSVSSSSTAGAAARGLVAFGGDADGERVEVLQHRGADHVRRRDDLRPGAEVAAQRQDPRPRPSSGTRRAARGRPRGRRGGSRRSTGTRRRRGRPRSRGRAAPRSGSSCRRLVSWNSSTIRWANLAAVGLADLGLGQQPDRLELQVLEVEARAGRLGGSEVAVEEAEQLADVVVGEPRPLRPRRPGRSPRAAPSRTRRAARRFGFRSPGASSSSSDGRTSRCPAQSSIAASSLRRCSSFSPLAPSAAVARRLQRRHRRRHVAGRGGGKPRLGLAAAAQLLVGADHPEPEAPRANQELPELGAVAVRGGLPLLPADDPE